MKRIASILSAILLVNNLATVGLAYENYENEQEITVTEYEVVEDTTDLSYQNLEDSDIASLYENSDDVNSHLEEIMTMKEVENTDEVPYGNYMTRDELFWANDAGITNMKIPDGWHVFDYFTCACGSKAVGIQGDNQYGIVHEGSTVTGKSHYYQWNVTLADGSVVPVNGSELMIGEARSFTTRSTNTVLTFVRTVYSDGIIFHVVGLQVKERLYGNQHRMVK